MGRNIIRIGLVVTVAAVFPVTAAHAKYELNPGESPVYVTGIQSPDDRAYMRGTEQQLVASQTVTQVQSPDDRSLMRATEQQLIPVAPTGTQVQSPDDRPFTRGTVQQSAPVASDDGIQVDTYGVTGFGLALLLLAGGTTIVIRHRRKTPLSPA